MRQFLMLLRMLWFFAGVFAANGRTAKRGGMFAGFKMATSRLDIQQDVDRLMFIAGRGHLLGLPTQGGASSNATTGVPTNAIAGFAPSAMFFNFKSTTLGQFFYINTGTQASATWTNIV
jgi:hypothetical protein